MNEELAQANQEVVGAQVIQQVNDELFQTLAKILDMPRPLRGQPRPRGIRYATAIAIELGMRHERSNRCARPGSARHRQNRHLRGGAAQARQADRRGVRVRQDPRRPRRRVAGNLHGLRHLAPFVRTTTSAGTVSGYPDRLKGDDIPMEARIWGVCDSVEAMSSDRPYRKGMSLEEVIAEVKRCANTKLTQP